MIDTSADIQQYLADWGQPITLSWRSTRREAVGVVGYDVDPIRFLSQGRAIPACVVAMARADALTLTPDWSVTVGGEIRPVLETTDDRSGLINVYLGDATPC